jgi:hypothetical protein
MSYGDGKARKNSGEAVPIGHWSDGVVSLAGDWSRQILLIGAIACLIWSSILILFGGFDIYLAGFTVRSNAVSRLWC